MRLQLAYTTQDGYHTTMTWPMQLVGYMGATGGGCNSQTLPYTADYIDSQRSLSTRLGCQPRQLTPKGGKISGPMVAL